MIVRPPGRAFAAIEVQPRAARRWILAELRGRDKRRRPASPSTSRGRSAVLPIVQGLLRVASPLIILAAATLPFLTTLGAGFVSDDYFALARYKDAHQSLGRFAADAVLTMTDVPTSFYRPLAFITLWIETRLWGVTVAWPYHLTNLLLHAGVSLLMWSFLRTLVAGMASRGSAAAEAGPSNGRGLAVLAAVLLFAIFPRRVEPVAWVACRPDLLAAFLAMAAACVYLRGVARDSRRLVVASAVLWFGSLLSKESAILLPLAWWVAAPRPASPAPAGRARWRWWDAVPFGLAALAHLTLRRGALGVWIGGYGADTIRPSPIDLLRAARHVAYLLLPPIEAADDSVSMARLVGVAIVALLAALATFAWRGRRDASVRMGLAWMACALLPVAALPVSLATTMNDRLLYLPGVGMACGLIALFARLRAGRLLFVVLPLAMVFCVQTMVQARRWRVAGVLSGELIRQLANDLGAAGDPAAALGVAPEVADTIYLAAVPDSYRGAYMLRTAIPEALRVSGLVDVPPIVVLTRYFVSDPDFVPVEASRPDAVSLRIAGCDGQARLLPELLPSPSPMPELLPSPSLAAMPEAMPSLSPAATGTIQPPPAAATAVTMALAAADGGAVADRYHRSPEALVHLPRERRVWLAMPRSIAPLEPGGPAVGCGRAPETSAAAPVTTR